MSRPRIVAKGPVTETAAPLIDTTAAAGGRAINIVGSTRCSQHQLARIERSFSLRTAMGGMSWNHYRPSSRLGFRAMTFLRYRSDRERVVPPADGKRPTGQMLGRRTECTGNPLPPLVSPPVPPVLKLQPVRRTSPIFSAPRQLVCGCPYNRQFCDGRHSVRSRNMLTVLRRIKGFRNGQRNQP